MVIIECGQPEGETVEDHPAKQEKKGEEGEGEEEKTVRPTRPLVHYGPTTWPALHIYLLPPSPGFADAFFFFSFPVIHATPFVKGTTFSFLNDF